MEVTARTLKLPSNPFKTAAAMWRKQRAAAAMARRVEYRRLRSSRSAGTAAPVTLLRLATLIAQTHDASHGWTLSTARDRRRRSAWSDRFAARMQPTMRWTLGADLSLLAIMFAGHRIMPLKWVAWLFLAFMLGLTAYLLLQYVDVFIKLSKQFSGAWNPARAGGWTDFSSDDCLADFKLRRRLNIFSLSELRTILSWIAQRRIRYVGRIVGMKLLLAAAVYFGAAVELRTFVLHFFLNVPQATLWYFVAAALSFAGILQWYIGQPFGVLNDQHAVVKTAIDDAEDAAHDLKHD